MPPSVILVEFNEVDPQKTVDSAMAELKRRNRVLPGDQVVVVSDVQSGDERIESVQVRTIASV